MNAPLVGCWLSKNVEKLLLLRNAWGANLWLHRLGGIPFVAEIKVKIDRLSARVVLLYPWTASAVTLLHLKSELILLCLSNNPFWLYASPTSEKNWQALLGLWIWSTLRWGIVETAKFLENALVHHHTSVWLDNRKLTRFDFARSHRRILLIQGHR